VNEKMSDALYAPIGGPLIRAERKKHSEDESDDGTPIYIDVFKISAITLTPDLVTLIVLDSGREYAVEEPFEDLAWRVNEIRRSYR
jgi:uncharacterized protein YlzI (FlbEa/FlbD family)